MDSNDYQTPDLASVLRTLAQYAPPSAPPTAVSQNKGFVDQTTAPDDELEEGEYDPSDPTNGLVHEHNIASVTPTHSVPQIVAAPELPTKSTVDPTSITDWPAALRHVMRTVARNEATMARVQRMIRVQHEHERQWWDGRQALRQKQEGREEGRKKLDAVLRSVGGSVATGGSVTTPEDDLAEIGRYDMKVYKASLEMVTAMTTELRNLGVPFFGMRSELLGTRQDKEPSLGYERRDEIVQKDPKAKLGQDDLRKFQKRMLELLEDLCKD